MINTHYMEEQTSQLPETAGSMHSVPKMKSWRTALLIIVAIGVIGVAGFILFRSSNKKTQEVAIDIPVDKPIEEPVKKEKAGIYIEPAVQSVKTGQLFTNEILLDANEYPITVVKIVLQFDPAYLSLTSLEPGSFFTNPTVLAKSIDNVKGSARVSIGSLLPQSGKGNVASVSAIAKTATSEDPTFLTFSTSTTAYASSKDEQAVDQNILTTLGESVVTITP